MNGFERIIKTHGDGKKKLLWIEIACRTKKPRLKHRSRPDSRAPDRHKTRNKQKTKIIKIKMCIRFTAPPNGTSVHIGYTSEGGQNVPSTY